MKNRNYTKKNLENDIFLEDLKKKEVGEENVRPEKPKSDRIIERKKLG